jgi:DNA repair photolyase
MDYYELRKKAASVIPRMTQLFKDRKRVEQVKEKGRKKNYKQFSLKEDEWRKQERLLNTEEINNFLEVSLRASACPMPFNMDIWDGLICPYKCVYCYANAFRASLYTAFFDNSKTMGYRHCNPTYYKAEMDKLLPLRAKSLGQKSEMTGIRKAFALDIPLRMGIRFEDFLRPEKKKGVSLEMLEYLAEIAYPVMINSKSDIPGTDPYVKALSENPAGAAIHETVITSNDIINKKLEPGAPNYERRLQGIKNLVSAGVRVVARIEPYLFLLNDKPEDVHYYMESMWEAGVRNITFDTYSYTALNQGIRQSFINAGYDFDRMYIVGCDSQPFGSLLLGAFMKMFRDFGFSSSTFDMGNVADNDMSICCEVEDHFKGGWNYGCTVMASRFVISRKGKPTSWSQFVEYVDKHGGFLSEEIKQEVHRLWNIEGNVAYSVKWSQGLTPMGQDQDGQIWVYNKKIDNRIDILNSSTYESQ